MGNHPFYRLTSISGVAAAALIVVLLGGCATTAPPPTTQMAEARSAVRQAEDMGGMEHAALDYRRAQQKLEEAQAALSGGKHDRARRLAEQATVDAELASMKARTAKTRATVAELRASIKLLRDETVRGEN